MLLEQLFQHTKLTATDKHIIEFIEKNPRLVIKLSLEEVSSQCFVSQASIIRLCKKLGTTGFADFKIKLASQISYFVADEKELHVDLPLQQGDSCEDIAEKFYNITSQALHNTYESLDYHLIKRAANLIAHAGLIHIYGRGESQILAEDFHYKLLRLGLNSSLETISGFQEAKCLKFSNKVSQVALIISHYCNTRHVNYIVDELTTSKIPFILLTANPNPWPYNIMAAATLYIKSSESRFKMGSFMSRTSMLYTLDCLYGQIFAMNYKENKNNLAQFSQRKLERSYFYNMLEKNKK